MKYLIPIFGDIGFEGVFLSCAILVQCLFNLYGLPAFVTGEHIFFLHLLQWPSAVMGIIAGISGIVYIILWTSRDERRTDR